MKLTVTLFNEAHQRAFGCAPHFGRPERDGPDHCPVVSVVLEVDNLIEPIPGKGCNQKAARQDAVDQVMKIFDRLPYELRRAIEEKVEAF